MKLLLVGLGNIGPEYACTRHNMGFLVLDNLAMQQKATFQSGRLAYVATFAYQHHQIYLVKPTTLMNNSGKAVSHWLNRLQIPIEQILIVVDDIALPFGKMRLNAQGGDAGHNGLKSVAHLLASFQYPRLRIGIGNAFPKGRLVDFVLGNFSEAEQKELPFLFNQSSEILLAWCNIGIVQTMNQFNKS